MSDVKISIIMPVYKVEEYVGKAIESILSQTFTDYEFLIVDDGTPDRSGEICDAYAAKDSRIQVIHKENGGAPSARNTAIDMAKGNMCIFLIPMIGQKKRCYRICTIWRSNTMRSLSYADIISIPIMGTSI